MVTLVLEVVVEGLKMFVMILMLVVMVLEMVVMLLTVAVALAVFPKPSDTYVNLFDLCLT